MSTTPAKACDYEGVDSDSESDREEIPGDEPALPTLRKYERSLSWWREFMSIRGVSKERCLEPLRPPPTEKCLRKFACWCIERPRKKTQNVSRITVQTLLTYFTSFVKGYQRATITRLDKEMTARVEEYIRGTLKQEFSLSTAKREKHVCLVSDLRNLTRTLWCTESVKFVHERQRVQFTLFLLIHAFSGARAGTFIESTSYPGSMRCLTYQDVGLHVYWNRHKGKFGYILELTERFTKANIDTSENTTRITMKDHENLFLDPVWFFVALAFADKAFKGIATLEQFWTVRPKEGQDMLQFEWNADVLNTPVFRKVYSSGTSSKPWSCQSMFSQLGKVSQDAGYQKGTFTVHTIRRGFANVLNKTTTTAEQNQALGWRASSNMFGTSYQSRICSVDGQSLFLGEVPETCHIELLRSAARHQNTDIPQKLCARSIKELERRPDVLDIFREMSRLPEGAKDDRAKLERRLKNIKQQALARYQLQWQTSDYDRRISGINDVNHTQRDFHALLLLMPERSHLADMKDILFSCHDENRKTALAALITISSRKDDRVLYRPEEVPARGRCPVAGCRMEVRKLPLRQQSKHIHDCRRHEILLISPNAEYCYRCCIWFQSSDDFDRHCQSHLATLDSMCEVWTYRNTLVTPGVCPFCVGQKQSPATQRYHQFLESWRLWRHVDTHLMEKSWPGPCPHPHCKLVLKDAEDFDCHMIDFHGKDIVARNSSKRKFEDIDQAMESEGIMEAEILTRLGTERGYKTPSRAYRPRMPAGPDRPPPYQGMDSFRATDPGLTIDDALASASTSLLIGDSHVLSPVNRTKRDELRSKRKKVTPGLQLEGQWDYKRMEKGSGSYCSLFDRPYEGSVQGRVVQHGDDQQSSVRNIERHSSSNLEELSNSLIGYSPSSPSWNGCEDEDSFDEDEMGDMIA